MSSILFKISGDLIYNQEVLDEIRESINEHSKVGVIYGFGTILSSRLREEGISFSYETGIRQTTPRGLELALEVSEEIKKFLQSKLPGATLITPIICSGGQIINTNADDLVFRHIEDYDFVVIYALKGRNKDKFKGVLKVRVVEK